MQTYESIKRVQASFITEVHSIEADGSARLSVADPGQPSVIVQTPAGFASREKLPQPGDAYVVYEDGYESWSPKDAFEKSCRLVNDAPRPAVTSGRIVHYVLPVGAKCAGEIRPAVIVRVWQQLDHPSNPGMSNLQVFTDGPNDEMNNISTLWTGSVSYSEEPKPGTWHWPPRA